MAKDHGPKKSRKIIKISGKVAKKKKEAEIHRTLKMQPERKFEGYNNLKGWFLYSQGKKTVDGSVAWPRSTAARSQNPQMWNLTEFLRCVEDRSRYYKHGAFEGFLTFGMQVWWLQMLTLRPEFRNRIAEFINGNGERTFRLTVPFWKIMQTNKNVGGFWVNGKLRGVLPIKEVILDLRFQYMSEGRSRNSRVQEALIHSFVPVMFDPPTSQN